MLKNIAREILFNPDCPILCLQTVTVIFVFLYHQLTTFFEKFFVVFKSLVDNRK